MLNQKLASASWSNLYKFIKLVTDECSAEISLKALYCDEKNSLDSNNMSVHLSVCLNSPGFIKLKTDGIANIDTYYSSKDFYFQFDECCNSLYWEGKNQNDLLFRSYLFL